MRRSRGFVVVATGCLLSILLGHSTAQSQNPPVGDTLPGLTSEELARFQAGIGQFTQVEDQFTGLGPVFNGRSCIECHGHPFGGGSSPDLIVSRETRFGRIVNGLFDPMIEEGGPLVQRRSVREVTLDCPTEGEVVPANATLVSRRITTPVFGAGLIDAIPDSEILQHADPNDRDRDGISGKPNMVFNLETFQDEIGRFGWKAHVPTLHQFSGDAYLNELGITNPTFSDENLPQGQAIPDECDLLVDIIEDDSGLAVDELTDFMRFLAPPPRGPITQQVQNGSKVFANIGCAKCHVPTLMTGDNLVEALRFKPVNLYSDLLLHGMGPSLEDGIPMGSAKGNEWRTAPLWGLSQRKFFLHDGRTDSIEGAIRRHGGEGKKARDRFKALTRRDREALLAFLRSL